MAIPDLITSISDPVIAMVRSYNVILDDQGTFPSKKLMDYLNRHAFPRIRGYLISATDSEQRHIFYTSLSDLSNPASQMAAQTLVLAVMTESIVKDEVYRIAAAFAASWALRYLVAQIPEQQAMGKDLESEAMKDLINLVKSPELKSAAAAVKASATTAKGTSTVPRIYMALDVDPTSYDATAGTAITYSGAVEGGVANLWIGGFQITAPVHPGDRPYEIMQAIGAAVRAQLMLNPAPGSKFNLVLGPNEGSLTPGNKYIPDPLGVTQFVFPTVFTEMGYLDFHAFQYDPTMDALFCTLELINGNGTLGIKGILYGEVADSSQYQSLSEHGPASVFIDLSQAKGTKAASTVASSQLNTMTLDTFWFQIATTTKVTARQSLVKYQIANLGQIPGSAPGSPQPRIVQIPAGSKALDVARLIANDMNLHSFDQKVLGAVRSPTTATIMGDPVDVPGLRVVPYRPSGYEDQIVFDLFEVSPEITFGLLPPTYITNNAFDNSPKSLVLSSLFIPAQAAKLSPLSVLSGEVKSVQAQPSSLMQAALDDWRFFNTSY